MRNYPMNARYPTTINGIMDDVAKASRPYAPIPYATDNPEASYFNPEGYAVDPSTYTGNSISPVGNNVKQASLNPVQQWLQKHFPNTYAGAGMDKSAVSNGVGEILDKGGANWNEMSFGEKGGAVLGAAQSVYNAYNSYKQNKLAKEQFNFAKDSFNRNFEASAKTTNAALADRQATRVARDPSAYASVADYMKKYGV